MKVNFCTLFNKNYLSRGLLTYQSLKEHCNDFNLYVFAFDDDTYNYLKQANLPNLIPVSLKEFEDEELLKVKSSRTMAEYCWTCTASTILYCITKFSLDNCTYIDADMYFYSSPSVLIDEMGDKSVLITSHRYTSTYDQSAASGKYCVQFVTFKNTEEGLQVLNDWRNACIEWCFARVEDGKFGDQKYLDYWPSKYTCVHELENLGGGVAPWNMQQYNFQNEGKKIIGKEKSTGKIFELIFFHFHGLKLYEDGIVHLTGSLYEMSTNVRQLLFKPYVKELNKTNQLFFNKGINAFGNTGKAPAKPLNYVLLVKIYLAGLKESMRNLFGAYLIKQRAHSHYFKISRFIRN